MLLLLLACTPEPVDSAPPGLPPICHTPTPWAAGTPIFAEDAAGWGLSGVVAQRFHVADFDNDGWPDVLARLSSGSDSFVEGGARVNWLLHNTGNGTFEDVTYASGAFAVRDGTDPTVGRWADIAAWGDVDNDGDVDLLTGKSDPGEAGGDTTEILYNDGTGQFSFGPAESGVRSLGTGGQPSGLSFTDYDHDGNLDLWSPQFGNALSEVLQDRLLRGDGAGGFEDVTIDAGLETHEWRTRALNAGTAHSWGWGGSACDLNDDGFPELMASSYGRFPNHLWQSVGDGTFVNRGVDSGYAFDANQDWTDNESARCYCSLHRDAVDCADVPEPAYTTCETEADVFRWDHTTGREPYQLGGNSGTVTCADVDNDGDIDLVTGEIAHWDVGQSSDKAELLLNSGEPDVRFDRPGNEVTGLDRRHPATGWDEGHTHSLVVDVDNDGWPDIYWAALNYPDEGNRGRLYHQVAPATFEQVDVADFFDHHGIEGAGAADFDRDGDLDLLIGHGSEGVRFEENLLGESTNFVQLLLEGTDANTMAVGARVTLTSDGVTQTQLVEGGHGHYGAQLDRVLHFGLGVGCEAEVTVRWPDTTGSEQTFTVPAGYRFRVVQGEEPERVE
jgi:hypothetical protein